MNINLDIIRENLPENNKSEYLVDLSPPASSLIESLRDVGYSIETAVADIIDNSITAKSDKIFIDFIWNNGNPYIALSDNGYGMDKATLINAMKFGSANPNLQRNIDDLGRFGLGMKTSSISQCRRLTVISKKDNIISCCEWDLDEIQKNKDSKWNVKVYENHKFSDKRILSNIFNKYLDGVASGTIVIWNNLDRLCSDKIDIKNEKYFNQVISDVRNHLEITFHRFLKPEPGKKKLNIFINNDNLNAFNPFNPSNLATQELEEQKIMIENAEVIVQPYILPHHNKLSKEEYNQYAGQLGYLQNQGFYIYRNKRLIIKGTWFRLIKKSELNKLIRVKIDIPNTLDHLWKIDVKKSHAVPPESIKKQLKNIILKIEDSGHRVYRQRGIQLKTNVKHPFWIKRASNNQLYYEINRKHPLLNQFRNGIDQKERFDNILSLIENYFPTDSFFHDFANEPQKISKNEFGEHEISSLLDYFIEFLKKENENKEDFINIILESDPFASHKEMTIKLINERNV